MNNHHPVVHKTQQIIHLWCFLDDIGPHKCPTKSGRQNPIGSFCGCCKFDSVRRKQGSCSASITEITALACGIHSCFVLRTKKLPEKASSFRKKQRECIFIFAELLLSKCNSRPLDLLLFSHMVKLQRLSSYWHFEDYLELISQQDRAPVVFSLFSLNTFCSGVQIGNC